MRSIPGHVCTCAEGEFGVSPALVPMSKTVTAEDAETALGLSDVVASGKEQMCTCERWHNEG